VPCRRGHATIDLPSAVFGPQAEQPHAALLADPKAEPALLRQQLGNIHADALIGCLIAADAIRYSDGDPTTRVTSAGVNAHGPFSLREQKAPNLQKNDHRLNIMAHF